MSRATPPFAARIPCVPLAELCNTALQWQKMGEDEAASHLVHWLRPLLWEKPPYSLWCREVQYEEKPLPSLEGIEPVCGSFEDLIIVPNIAVFTTAGLGTSMGMYRKGEVEIRAMGPQTLPLNELNGFGIDRLPEEGPFKNWTRCSANPESWIELKVLLSSVIRLDLKLMSSEPMVFAFYVKAKSCQVDTVFLKPRCLQRFNGEASRVLLDELTIESTHPHKIQIIPLAGDGCFWNCDFLIAFEINRYDGKISFLIN